MKQAPADGRPKLNKQTLCVLFAIPASAPAVEAHVWAVWVMPDARLSGKGGDSQQCTQCQEWECHCSDIEA